ncbi:MAG: YcbK family protein, partial [Gammaproteobacteria bacterium]
QQVSSKSSYQVISGYRSPTTNAKLNRISSGVAKRSLHMQGKAIDIRLPGVELKHLRQAALSLKAGGVGYYPKSNFVHVDTGRPRFW